MSTQPIVSVAKLRRVGSSKAGQPIVDNPAALNSNLPDQNQAFIQTIASLVYLIFQPSGQHIPDIPPHTRRKRPRTAQEISQISHPPKPVIQVRTEVVTLLRYKLQNLVAVSTANTTSNKAKASFCCSTTKSRALTNVLRSWEDSSLDVPRLQEDVEELRELRGANEVLLMEVAERRVVKDVKEALEKRVEDLRGVTKEKEAFEEELVGLWEVRARNGALENEVGELKTRLEARGAEVETLKEEVFTLEAENRGLEAKVGVQQKRIDSMMRSAAQIKLEGAEED
ncbi:hypothetical protein HDV00_006379 [Rhizophlyctis rosea]|nr:hypothetical protein HDV00_006379 [Rhizophlyctis rosea]